MNGVPGRAARIVIDIILEERFLNTILEETICVFLYFVFVLFYFKMVGEGDRSLLKRERFCICICVLLYLSSFIFVDLLDNERGPLDGVCTQRKYIYVYFIYS